MPYAEEFEQSFSVEPAHLPRVLDAVWPRTEAVTFGPLTYQLIDQSIKTSVHFYSTLTGMELRERLKLSMNKGDIRSVRQRKVIKPGQKFEEVISKAKKGHRALTAVNDFGRIVGAFLKERATIKYSCGPYRLKIGVDALVPFDPADPSCHGETVYHLEFEGSDSSVVAAVLASALFATQVGPYAAGLDIPDTKWIIASRYCPQSRQLAFDTLEELQSYYQRIVRDLTRPLVPLDGLPSRAVRAELFARFGMAAS